LFMAYSAVALARQIAELGNVISLVSIEGFPSDTGGRRRQGAHETALRALNALRSAGAWCGFAAMNKAVNVATVQRWTHRAAGCYK
jgi:hypothetical protein